MLTPYKMPIKVGNIERPYFSRTSTIPIESGVSLDPLTTLLTSASGATNATYNAMIDAAIKSLRSDDVIKYTDAIFFGVNETQAQDQWMLLRDDTGDEDFVADQTTAAGTLVKSAGAYLKGDGTSGYIETNYNPGDGSGIWKLTQNDAAIWIIGGGNTQIGASDIILAAYGSSGNYEGLVIASRNNPGVEIKVNSGLFTLIGDDETFPPYSVSGGFRNNSSSLSYDINGFVGTQSKASFAPVSRKLSFFSRNIGGGYGSFSNFALSFAILGSSAITKTHVENVKTAMGL